jgi:hypothetical protein
LKKFAISKEEIKSRFVKLEAGVSNYAECRVSCDQGSNAAIMQSQVHQAYVDAVTSEAKGGKPFPLLGILLSK